MWSSPAYWHARITTWKVLLWMILPLVFSYSAGAAEIRLLCAVGLQAAMERLQVKFETATGHMLRITYANLGTAIQRVESGETYDLAVMARTGIKGFTKAGKADPETVKEIATSVMGVVVRKGAPKPDISTPEAFKRALLAAN